MKRGIGSADFDAVRGEPQYITGGFATHDVKVIKGGARPTGFPGGALRERSGFAFAHPSSQYGAGGEGGTEPGRTSPLNRSPRSSMKWNRNSATPPLRLSMTSTNRRRSVI